MYYLIDFAKKKKWAERLLSTSISWLKEEKEQFVGFGPTRQHKKTRNVFVYN